MQLVPLCVLRVHLLSGILVPVPLLAGTLSLSLDVTSVDLLPPSHRSSHCMSDAILYVHSIFVSLHGGPCSKRKLCACWAPVRPSVRLEITLRDVPLGRLWWWSCHGDNFQPACRPGSAEASKAIPWHVCRNSLLHRRASSSRHHTSRFPPEGTQQQREDDHSAKHRVRSIGNAHRIPDSQIKHRTRCGKSNIAHGLDSLGWCAKMSKSGSSV